jgi:hypothetical protein
MIIRKHATRQHNLPDIARISSWHSISKVPKLFEQTTFIVVIDPVVDAEVSFVTGLKAISGFSAYSLLNVLVHKFNYNFAEV